MPGRKTPLVTDEIYHVYNRGINKQPTFTTNKEHKRAIQAISFYKYKSLPIKLSRFLKLQEEDKQRIKTNFLEKNEVLVNIIAYVLMPNHFHFLLKQNCSGGISKFMGNFLNSYTKYFNTRHNRDGALFLGQFKAVRIEDDNQLLHIHRYIHLNPHSSYLMETSEKLLDYPWSSLGEFIGKSENEICDKKLISPFFKTNKSYLKFVLNQADYQRKLKVIKHLVFE
ncbi:transposase [Patescibacteria group bacterium]|nr:transposase [Patescibacteria group bacterium]